MFFKEQIKKRIKNEKGLTLIELLAVIVILAIIAAIAIPAIGNIINNSRDKAVLSDIQNAVSSAKIALADGSCTSATKCEGADIEFESDKVKITSIEFTPKTDKAEASVSIVAELADEFDGSRIPEAIGTKDKPFTGKALTITEDELNSILD